MKQIIFFLLIILLGCSDNNSQKKDVSVIDSKIEDYLEKSQDSRFSKSERQEFTEAAFKIIKKRENDSINRTNYFKVANRYFSLYDLDSYFLTSKEILKLSTNAFDSVQIAKSNQYIGDYYFEIAKKDSAYYFYTKAEKIYGLLRNKESYAKIVLYKAYILLYEKDYLGSEIATIKALDYADDDELLKYECYINLGSSLLGLENYTKALEYSEKALSQLDKLEDDVFYNILLAQTYNNIGLVHLKKQDFKSAALFFNKGLKIKEIKERHPILYSSLLDNLGYTKFKQDDKSSFNYFKSSFKIRNELKSHSGIIKSKLHLAEYYYKEKQFETAVNLNVQGYKLAKKHELNGDVLSALKLLIKNDLANALEYSAEYIELNDRLNKAEREIKGKLARIEFETDEIINEKERLTEQKKVILTISISLMFFAILLYMVLYLRSKQKDLLSKQQQQKVNEEIYKLIIDQKAKIDDVRNLEKNRIAKELHDGILNRLTSTRLNLFVLSKRRDDETIQNCIKYIDDIQNIEKEVRAIAHDLNNEDFTLKNSFKNIISELLDEQDKLFPPKCKYEIDKEIKWDLIDVSVKINLFRILQESLNNCNKYAHAKNIIVKFIEINLNTVCLTIEDDGVGFNVEKTSKGIGLKNISDRAKSIKGDCNIISKKNIGTTINIIFRT